MHRANSFCNKIYAKNSDSLARVVAFYKLLLLVIIDRLCGLVVRVSGYRYRGPGFDPRRYQIF